MLLVEEIFICMVRWWGKCSRMELELWGLVGWLSQIFVTPLDFHLT